jgi:hypothetical protein
MMQDGLHIGLAAWINKQRNSSSFVVYPASPVATDLLDLDTVRNATDLAKAAEFALLVNFGPRQGQVADVFSSTSLLWNVHRDILGRLDFATEPWTSAEKDQYRIAQDILYTNDTSGRLAPSQKLHLYGEMKIAYQDLEKGGGTQAELTQALANWITLGHKQLVEDALETIVRLASRSSRNQAETERALLEPSRLPIRGDGLPFATTYFAPISAIARETWLEARVSFEDLDRTVGNDPMASKWKTYLANRVGEVSFNYAAVSCLRPWYTPALYAADDWKFSTEGALVSKGNGSDGLLPAYVEVVYLVAVKDVTVRAMPPREERPVLTKQRPVLTLEEAKPRLARSKSLDHTDVPRKGVRARALNKNIPPTRLTVLTSPPIVRRFTVVDLSQRMFLAQGLLDRSIQVPLPPPEAPKVYVAGLGCAKVPFAPNPNVSYTW